MTYPLTTPVVQIAYEKLDNDLAQIYTRCQAVVNATAGGAAAALNLAVNVAQACIAYRSDFATVSANAALVAQLIPYFQQQKAGAGSLAVQTELINLNTLAGNLLNAFALDYPHNGSNVLLDRTFNLTTGEVWLTFTAAQGPNFMPAVTALLAAFS
jgi:hypothetical protein